MEEGRGGGGSSVNRVPQESRARGRLLAPLAHTLSRPFPSCDVVQPRHMPGPVITVWGSSNNLSRDLGKTPRCRLKPNRDWGEARRRQGSDPFRPFGPGEKLAPEAPILGGGGVGQDSDTSAGSAVDLADCLPHHSPFYLASGTLGGVLCRERSRMRRGEDSTSWNKREPADG